MATRPSAETLCLSCGMCCSGMLHNWTNLNPQEINQANQFGLDVFTQRDGTAAFRQPCAAYEEPSCTIYAQRPQACREYICPLLMRLEDGETSLEEALEHTLWAHQLITSLQSKMTADVAGLPLEWQVRMSWPPSQALPPDVQPVFNQLRGLLRDIWRVKWRRKNKKSA